MRAPTASPAVYFDRSEDELVAISANLYRHIEIGCAGAVFV
jgi:hypothetical protein